MKCISPVIPSVYLAKKRRKCLGASHNLDFLSYNRNGDKNKHFICDKFAYQSEYNLNTTVFSDKMFKCSKIFIFRISPSNNIFPLIQ